MSNSVLRRPGIYLRELQREVADEEMVKRKVSQPSVDGSTRVGSVRAASQQEVHGRISNYWGMAISNFEPS